MCYDNGREAFCQAADGSGQPESIFTAPGLDGIDAVAPDGKRLLFVDEVKRQL